MIVFIEHMLNKTGRDPSKVARSQLNVSVNLCLGMSYAPYAVPGPSSVPASIKDCPSSSWLFNRVGAFFSSFSYTNSSSRTSATRKLNYTSHKTTVKPNLGRPLWVHTANLTFGKAGDL